MRELLYNRFIDQSRNKTVTYTATGGDIRQAPACPEQPGQSRLPEPGSNQRQAAAPVTSLAFNETAGHLQSGSADPQGAGHSHSGVSQ